MENSILKLTHRGNFLNRKMASQINNISVLIWLVALTLILSEVHLTSSLPRHKDSRIVTLGKYIERRNLEILLNFYLKFTFFS